VRVECGMCLADRGSALAGCAGRKLAHRGAELSTSLQRPPRTDTLLEQHPRAAGDSQPPTHRLGTTQDPAGDAPAEGRVARRVIHALIDRFG